MRPRLVTATDKPLDYIEKSSSIYQYSKTQTYFEQCFKIVRQLGKGVFGEALEVENLEDGKRYAIKRALYTFESSGNRRQKLHEALVHESIPAHPNLVGFVKAWEERGRLYIQTELCGSSLADYRRCFGILEENELFAVLLSMLQAINHMHSMGILHLDVKPSNIFISSEGSSCKLGDFGLAFDLNQDSMDSAEEGDKYYMAPEILNNPPTTAADVYSLGMTLLELATSVDLDKDKQSIRNGEIPTKWFGGEAY
ncbi:kinase domain protein [Cooperia oncophora]